MSKRWYVVFYIPPSLQERMAYLHGKAAPCVIHGPFDYTQAEHRVDSYRDDPGIGGWTIVPEREITRWREECRSR